MQYKNEKTKYFANILGSTIKEQRELRTNSSINKLAHEFELDVGNISRIENGNIDCKVVTLWKIAEAMDIKLSGLIKIFEDKLGDDFKLTDE